MADKISNFAKTIYPEVLKGLKKKGYNTDLADIITSQMAMESDYGKYDKIGSFNITGTKWFPTMTNRDYVVNPDDGIKYANFKSYEDQVDFYLANIKNKWGEKAFKAKNSKEWAEALHPKKGQKYSASDAKDYEKRITGLTSLQKEINNLYKNEDPFSGKSYHPSINNELITSNSSIEGTLDEALEMIFEEEDEEDAMLALAEQFQEEEDDEIEEELFGSNEEVVVDTEDPKTKEEVEEKATERDLIQEALNKRAEQYAMIESMFTLGEEEEEDEYFLQMGGGARPKNFSEEDMANYMNYQADTRELNSLLSLVLKSNKTPKRLGRLNRKKIENNFT